jgi:hypothetical protein
MAKFTWDSTSLVPETVTVDFPTSAKVDAEVETITFVEFSRIKNEKFIAECVETRVGKEVQKDVDVEVQDPDNPGALKTVKQSKKVYEANPINDVTSQQAGIIIKWLAESTQRGPTPRTVAYFKKVTEEYIGSWGLGHLAEMLFAINHTSEIMAISGNYLLLPRILELGRGVASVGETA